MINFNDKIRFSNYKSFDFNFIVIFWGLKIYLYLYIFKCCKIESYFNDDFLWQY